MKRHQAAQSDGWEDFEEESALLTGRDQNRVMQYLGRVHAKDNQSRVKKLRQNEEQKTRH